MLVPAALAAAVVAACAGGGYLVGNLLRSTPASARADAGPAASRPDNPADEEYEYYELPPFIATLNTPRRDRIMQVTIVLAMYKRDKDRVTKMLEKRKMELTSKLTLYLNSRTMEDVSGDRNLSRVLREIRDTVNDLLWPDQAPMIEKALVKNLALQ